MRENYKMQRLFVEILPPAGSDISLNKQQTHYLLHVLRLQTEQNILLFDGKHGEWRARCTEAGKKTLRLRVEEQTRQQPAPQKRLIYCFAPLKQARLDYMVQKAVEMGASFLQPVLTQHTQIRSVNHERLCSNTIEAAEQCGLLSIPETAATLPLAKLLHNWQQTWGKSAKLIFCDEAQIHQEHSENAETSQNPLPQLLCMKTEQMQQHTADSAAVPAVGLLIGPEGGFSDTERKLLYAQDFVAAIPLGSRILRADTAAVAALALIQATLGDW